MFLLKMSVIAAPSDESWLSAAPLLPIESLMMAVGSLPPRRGLLGECICLNGGEALLRRRRQQRHFAGWSGEVAAVVVGCQRCAILVVIEGGSYNKFVNYFRSYVDF